jgi:Ca2+-binding RTX toxin-like protein
MASSFIVNKADLEFILKQIQVADLHAGTYSAPVSLTAAIQQVYGLSAADAALAPFGLRTVDGSDNNLLAGQSALGAADGLFPRLTDPVFTNEIDEAPFQGVTNTNYGVAGNVVDSDPRTISNLIVDMTAANPAAVTAALTFLGITGAAATAAKSAIATAYAATVAPATAGPAAEAALTAVLDSYGIQQGPEGGLSIPNLSPDIGLSPGFNSWMTFFGQFFDHGLDLVTKGGNGTVYVPLKADDPLIAGADKLFGTSDDLPANLRFMALSRATVTPDGAGVAQHQNTTTSFIDQNQTYTSNASHQVFLREYVRVDVPGDGMGVKTIATGRLLDGLSVNGSLDGAIANWGEVKTQALQMLGIRLSDFDVHNVPLLLTDQYGKFIPGPNGYAQMVMKPDATHATYWYKEGTAAGITTEGAEVTNHAFLNDIAHHAAPGFVDTNHNGVRDGVEALQTADTLAGVGDDSNPNTYDDEMLASHFITGDGRGNENIALTAVHSVFHSEHNRLVEANKQTILEAANAGDIAFLNQWLLVDVTAVPADLSTLVWDGERMFQAARFVTEMQYQHLVFEEFARRIQPNVDPFVFTNSADIDPSIVAEFAHVVYRFGHSMLTDTVNRLENDLTIIDGQASQATLIEAFLNPQMYLAGGATIEAVNANLVRGLTRDLGNEIDEFVVPALQSNLLGLPLDLAALNIARGRDTGVPSLNETRRQLYNDFGAPDLKPYTSWVDFAQHIKNPMSIVNFIAAYGTHDSITTQTTLAGKRAAAMELVLGVDQGVGAAGVPADRLAFLNATGPYAGGSLGGLNHVDLWIGGLAEEKNEFGGMLGSTFNFVFEYQMEHLQNGDRLYYLSRTQGTNLLNQLEPNTFSDLVMRNTDLGGIYSTHLNGALFVTPDHILELDPGIAQDGADPVWDDPFQQAIDPKVFRVLGTDANNDGHYEGGTLRVSGGEHYVLGGTEGNDKLYGDKGIDTLWGDGGNDYLNAGSESDNVFGGDGDDIIEDPFGDDVLRGNRGNDVISGGAGIDLIFGDQENDYIILGQDTAEAFGGTGDDFILGGSAPDLLLGNEGNDWIEGGDGFDTIAGENSELFFNSPIVGHDVMWGQGNDQDYDAESGDDIMFSGPGVQRFEGMFGFDWAISKFDPGGARFDFQIPVFTNIPTDILRDRFDLVEAASGWIHNDVIDGDSRGRPTGGNSVGAEPTALFVDHVLTAEGIARINGLNAWFDGALNTLFGPGATSFRDGNILLGGDGSDTLRGRGGFDILDGDAWLNVRISIDMGGGVSYSAESMTSDTAVAGPLAGRVVDAAGVVQFGGRSLNSLMLDGTINPGQLKIVREIKYDETNNGNVDTAIFQGTAAEYDIEGRIVDAAGNVTRRAFDVNGDGFISVRDRDNGITGAVVNGVQLTSRGVFTDDTDLLKNIEQLQFADQTIVISGGNNPAQGTVTISDQSPFNHDNNAATPSLVTPIVGQVLTATLSGVVDVDGFPGAAGVTYEWQIAPSNAANQVWTKVQVSNTYTVRALDEGHEIRAVAIFTDAGGAIERIASTPTEETTVPFSVIENAPTNSVVAPAIPFALDGAFDGVIVNLTHVMAPGGDAGGRFKIVNVNGVDQLQVANGSLLDYEAVQTPVDNQYQIVINTYSDTIANGGVLLTSRQFTVMIGDVAYAAPSDIQWNASVPGNTALPGIGQIAQLSTVAADGGALTYSLLSSTGGTGGFTVSPTGAVSRTVAVMDPNTTYTLTVRVQDSVGGSRDEVFTIRTGTDPDNAIVAVGTTDHVIYGDDGNDTLTGGAGNDTLFGQDESDTLIGGAGNDVLHGGTGDSDTASYAGAASGVTVSLALAGQQNTQGAGLDTLIDIENATGTSHADNLTGNGGANVLIGGIGADVLTGGAGNDTLNGGADNDTYRFGIADGTDTIIEAGGTGDRIVLLTSSIALTSLNFSDSQTGTPVGNLVFTFNGQQITANNHFAGAANAVEFINFGGASYADYQLGTFDYVLSTDDNGARASFAGQNTVLTGDNNGQTITGNTGNDLLFGNGGTDVMNGGAGADLLAGGTGNDTVNGDGGNDVIVYDIDEGNGGGDTMTGGADTDTLSIIDTGGNDAETLSVAFNGTRITQIEGGGTVAADIERITARLGAGTDTLAYTSATGVTVDLRVGSASGFRGILGLEGAIAGIENVTGGAGADVLTGDAGVNALTGGIGADLLNGEAGNDTLSGGADADILNGGADADTLNGGAGNDNLNGGDGNDTAQFTGAVGNYAFSLNAANLVVADTRAGSPDGTDTLSAVEVLSFNGTALTLRQGTNGIDTVVGAGGNDLLLGFGGADILNANGGDDMLIGGAGNDALNGAGGNDTAVFSGPLASYGFTLNGANLVVTDNRGGSPDGIDTLNSIENAVFGTQTFGLAWGTNAANTLDTGGGADLLFGFGGDDELDGGAGADIMSGGLGNDDFNFDDNDSGLGAANRDVITDFLGGGAADNLDFSLVDANTATGGDQAFLTLLAGGAFTAAQQLRYSQIDTNGDNVADSTLIEGNIDADAAAEFEVLLQNYTGAVVVADLTL